MTFRWIVTLMGLTGLAGCGVPYREPPPRIVSTGPTLPIPSDPPPAQAVVERRAAGPDVPSDWVPPKGDEKTWKAIVIHHSGTPNGNVEIFDRWHRERLWDGVGYDFVIGNGSDSDDGQVEVTFRWRQQKVGAHCKTPDNWANTEAIGICLVGNFNQTQPTDRQLQALTKLVRFLQDRYAIPATRITGHHATPGANETDCPGALFPMDRLLAEVAAAPNATALGR